MKNVVLIIGIMAIMFSGVYFVFAQTDIEPPTIVSIIPPSSQSIDLDTLVYQDYPSTAPLGIGSVDLGEVIQSVVIDLGAEHRIFSVTLSFKVEATDHNNVIVQTSSTSDFEVFANLSNAPAAFTSEEWFKAERNQTGRYIRLLSENDSVVKLNDYHSVNISRL